MVRIIFKEHDGTEHQISAEPGASVMEAAVENQVPGILAECGGGCNCATCHCYVEESWAAKLPSPSELEKRMLESVKNPQPTSRLSCQIELTVELDGIGIRLPPAQF